jgi:hypothetical protein
VKSAVLQPGYNSFEDQKMCDLVQILDNLDFCPDHFIETIHTLDVLDQQRFLTF